MEPVNSDALIDQIVKLLDRKSPASPDKALVILPADRQRIEKAIGANVSTSKELADRIERAMSVSVDGMSIPLSPYLLDRLKSRAIRVDWEKFVPMTIKRLLEEYVGLR